MQKIILILILLFLRSGICFSQPQTAKVDERFELTSIACRIAGFEEYMECRVPKYADEIDTYFQPFIKDSLITYLKEIRSKYSVAYNAISSMANAIEIKDGEIYLQPQYDLSELHDTTELIRIDPRWRKATLTRCLVG